MNVRFFLMYYNKRHRAINPPESLPLPEDTFILSSLQFPAAALDSSFLSIFNWTVMDASMSWTDPKHSPFKVSFTLGKSQQSCGARCSERGGWGHTIMSLGICLSFGWHLAVAFTVFLVMPCEDIQGRGLPELHQKGIRMVGWVYSKCGGIYWGKLMAMCLLLY